MCSSRSSLAVLLLVASLSGSAQAQRFVGNAPSPTYATFPGAGTNLDFALFNGGYANYGQPAIYPNYPGYGGIGYGAGRSLGGYYTTLPNLNAPQVYNNMGSLMGAIQQSTVKPGSYRNRPFTGVSPTRRPR